ncbi:hypothetical protein J6590_039274 [Homalodisca vitripennis]|nr:hypothetical protein J6590_039274 [Homalodisca vitripennis]
MQNGPDHLAGGMLRNVNVNVKCWRRNVATEARVWGPTPAVYQIYGDRTAIRTRTCGIWAQTRRLPCGSVTIGHNIYGRKSYLGPNRHLSVVQGPSERRQHTGRSSTSRRDENIDEVKKIVLTNRRITVREVAENLNISLGSHSDFFLFPKLKRPMKGQRCAMIDEIQTASKRS